MNQIQPYLHKVQYYETDKMGIVHHSNYIRWFESARVEFLEQIGIPFAELERRGLLSPVLSVSCEYRTAAQFGDSVLVDVVIRDFEKVRFHFAYTVTDAVSGEVRAVGESSHCFIRDGLPVALKRADRELYERVNALIGGKSE